MNDNNDSWFRVFEDTIPITHEISLDGSSNHKQGLNISNDNKKNSINLCMITSLHLLCNTLKGESLQMCYVDPKSYFNAQFKAYIPSLKQKQAREILETHSITKLSIGAARAGICDDIIPQKTLCTDRDNFDLLEINNWMYLNDSMNGKGFDVLFAEHVLEHFDPMQVQVIAAASFSLLKPGGVFRIAVPDGYKPSPSYQQYIRAGGTPSNAGQNHMVSWTVDTLPVIFANTGFEIKWKEYFTANGEFITSDDVFNDDGKFGKINRSSRDKRNRKPFRDVKNGIGTIFASDLKEGELMYTSLWFDAIKPTSCDSIGLSTNL